MIRHALALCSAVGVAGCAGLLGTSDEHQDVIALICVCDDVAMDFGGAAACEAELGRRLDGASPNARSAWLDNFVKKQCDKGCEEAKACYHTPPTCLSDGQSCSATSECCAGLTCVSGTGVCG